MTDVTIDDLPPAVFIRDSERVPVFTISESPRFWPGEDYERTYNRLKGLAARRLMHQRQAGTGPTGIRRKGTGKTSPALFGADDLAVAKALMAVLDLSIADAEIMGTASLALYAWHETLNPQNGSRFPSPVAAALMGVLRATEFWSLRIATFHHDQTGQRAVLAAVLREDQALDSGLVLDPAYLPRASISILLTPLFLPLIGAFEKPRGN